MKHQLTRALPAAAIAAVIALSASTGAVASALITGADVKNGTLTSADLKNDGVKGKDIRDGSLTSGDLSAAALSALKGAQGPAGPAGPAGPTGATGPMGATGTPGVSALQFVTAAESVAPGANGIAAVSCPDGKRVLGVAADWAPSYAPAAARISPSLTGGTAFGHNDQGGPAILRITATCAAVG